MRSEVRHLGLKELNASDTSNYDKFKDVALTAGVPVEIAEFICPIDASGVTWGGGKIFLILFDDTTTAVTEAGTFEFWVESKDGSARKVGSARSENVGPSGQVAVPSEHMFLPRGSAAGSKRAFIKYIADASDTLDTTDHSITGVPVTIFYP